MFLKKMLTLLALSMPGFLMAQTVSLNAKVYDANKEAVTIGNIIIMDQDSQMVKGDVFFDGDLQVEWEYNESHFLKISSLGWADHFIDLKDCQEGCDFGEITMQSSSYTLGEIVVTEKIRLFEAVDGNIQVNVENTVLSDKESVIDVLRSSPGVYVQGENSVNIFGKGAAIIYVDGVEVQNMDVLESLGANEIKKIEIIKNPSAKYDAEGKAVINVYTKNATLEGVLGQVRAGLTQATYQRGSLVGNYSLKKKKYDFYIAGSWTPYKSAYEENYDREISSAGGISTLKNNIDADRVSLLNNSYRTKFGYQLNDRQKVTVEAKGRFRNQNSDKTNINDINPFDDNEFRLTSMTDGQQDFNYNTFTGVYDNKISDKKNLTIIASQSFVNSDQVATISEMIDDSNVRDSRSLGNNAFNIFIGRLDYKQPVLNDITMETGIKYSSSVNDGDTGLERMDDDGKYVVLPEYDIDFTYDEQNYAAYSSFRRDWGKLSTKLGVRYEYVIAKGAKTGVGDFIDRTYANLFPNAAMTYNFNESISTSLNYSKRIYRPKFFDLDPTINYIDAYSILQGNPELSPELVDNYELNFLYGGYPILSLTYSDSKDPTSLVVEKDPNNELINIGINRNLDYIKRIGAELIIPYQAKWWTSSNGVGFNRQYVRYNETFNNGEIATNNSFYVFSYQDFNVGNGWNFGGQFYWYGPGAEGITTYEGAHRVNAWIGKKINNGKYNVRLQFDDIFRSDIARGGLVIDNVSVNQSSYNDARRVRLSVTYKFGNLKKTTGGSNKHSDEIQRVEKKD